MLIVLEGCDGTGKTTIANNLKSVLNNVEIIHCTRETPNDYEFFKGLIEASKSRDIIADRFCYGQFVYQHPKDRKLTREQLTDLEILMLGANARVIHVAAPVATIKTRLSWRAEECPVEDITHRYINLFDGTLIKPHLWWTGSDTD